MFSLFSFIQTLLLVLVCAANEDFYHSPIRVQETTNATFDGSGMDGPIYLGKPFADDNFTGFDGVRPALRMLTEKPREFSRMLSGDFYYDFDSDKIVSYVTAKPLDYDLILAGDFHPESDSDHDLVTDDVGLPIIVSHPQSNRSIPNVTSGKATKSIKISADGQRFLKGSMSTILIPSFYLMVFLVSVPINICALLAFSLRIRPKKPAVIYVLNLACADLLFASLLPFKIAYHFGGNDWIFGAFMCRVVTTAFYCNMYCSVLLIACISVDRLLAIVYALKSRAWRSTQKSIIACVTMWVLSLAASVPLVLSEQTYPVKVDGLTITTCHDVQPSMNVRFYKIYFIVLCCVLFLLPLLITVVSYTRVIWSLSRLSHRKPEQSRKRTKALVMVLTVLVIFVLCFTPTNLLHLVHYLQFNRNDNKSSATTDSSHALYQLFLCLGSLNCLLDPLVYYFGSSQCQKQLSRALRCEKITEGSSSSSSQQQTSLL